MAFFNRYPDQDPTPNPNLQFYPSQHQNPTPIGSSGRSAGWRARPSVLSGSINPQGSVPIDPQYSGYNITGNIGSDGVGLAPGILAALGTSGYPGEPPLLDELGVNFNHIKGKTLAVLNPIGRIAPDIMADSDMAGPLLFCMLFATFLLFSGKVHFGYIYGVAVVGTISLHLLFNLMAPQGIEFSRTASVIGYCMLPLVIQSFFGVIFTMDNSIGYVLSAFVTFWCTFSASGFFVSVLQLTNARVLVAYPLAIFYTIFAIMTIFVETKPST